MAIDSSSGESLFRLSSILEKDDSQPIPFGVGAGAREVNISPIPIDASFSYSSQVSLVSTNKSKLTRFFGLSFLSASL